MGDCKSLHKTEVAINGKNDYCKGHWQSIRKARLCGVFHDFGIQAYSHTRYDCCEDSMPLMAKSIDIDPDDIDVSDTATFVWEIK